MPGIMNNAELDITCPKCKAKFKIKVGKLKRPGVTCPKCGLGFETSQFKRELDKIDRELKDFGEKFGNIKIEL